MLNTQERYKNIAIMNLVESSRILSIRNERSTYKEDGKLDYKLALNTSLISVPVNNYNTLYIKDLTEP